MGKNKSTRRGPTPAKRRRPPYVWFFLLGIIFLTELVAVIMIATERTHYLAIAMAIVKEVFALFAAFQV